MKWTRYHAAIATIAYAHLFSYPLEWDEFSRWLIGVSTISLADKRKIKKNFSHGDFLEIFPRKTFIIRRQIRKEVSIKKWQIARSVIPFLSLIPTILLIGVSGGLAMNNADFADDIDLFFIVSPHTLWISRLLIIILLDIIGRRRKFGEREEKDRFCLNMFVTSNNIALPFTERDLYSAHEVLQMIPMFDRNSAYQSFLSANSWVKMYLPNAWKYRQQTTDNWQHNEESVFKKFIFFYCLLPIAYCLEVPAKFFQRWYMRSHITSEVVSDEVLRFHPQDTRHYIRERYSKILKKYKVPLDSSFLKSLQ